MLWLVSIQAEAFPGIPFCPMGGPPGWANRFFDHRENYYSPPPPYYGVPYWQRYPQYVPVYPVGYPYRWHAPPVNRVRD